MSDATVAPQPPLGLCSFADRDPKVARPSQPWAGGRNPFGIVRRPPWLVGKQRNQEQDYNLQERHPTPTGFEPKAQGREERAPLGWDPKMTLPQRVCVNCVLNRVRLICRRFRSLACIISRTIPFLPFT